MSTPETPAAPETPAPEPTIEAGPDAKPEPKPRLLSHGERLLPVKLTGEEKIEKGARLAEIQSEQKKVEEALDTAKRQAKSRLESLSLEAEEIGATLRRGTEDRLVPYEEREEGSEAVLWRLDTGEEWTRRKLAPEERQGALPLVLPVAPEPEAKTLGRAAAEPEEGSNEGDRRKVLDALRGGKELTRKKLVAATGLSSEVVGDCLSDLVGLTAQVTKAGKGAGTRYARVLDAAAEPPAPPASPADPFALAPGPRA